MNFIAGDPLDGVFVFSVVVVVAAAVVVVAFCGVTVADGVSPSLRGETMEITLGLTVTSAESSVTDLATEVVWLVDM